MNILLTGGAGYIGSHASVVLTEAGHNVTIFDNFCNSHHSVIDALNKITDKELTLVEGDIRDTDLLDRALSDNKIEAVMHLAGLKSVAESVEKPALYFDNNVGGTLSLIKAMQKNNIKMLVFSSSATVYGEPQYLPIDEKHPLKAINPYGQSKIDVEKILSDLFESDKNWRIIALRYFNPIGEHSSKLIPENPKGTPNNLMPIIVKVAQDKLSHVNIYGDDYDTLDGTGVRDYIHVMDLVTGHLAGLSYIKNHAGFLVLNLGTGKGFSVKEMICEFEKKINKKIPIKIIARRYGDIAVCYASTDLAKATLGWEAKLRLEDFF